MSFLSVFVLTFVSLIGSCSLIEAQQLYVGKATSNCSNNENTALGYSCNGLNKTCQAYLIFRSQPPYTTVASISTLLGSDQSQLSQINSVSTNATFETNKLVIVPVNCSCSGEYSQANTSYKVQQNDGYFLIGNNTFQGLSTCQAIQKDNRKASVDIYPGERITVPLRCACPTKNQTDAGINYLLSYLVTLDDSVSAVSVRFGADTGTTLEANELTFDSTIYPFTTLLVPLQNPPSASQTVSPPTPSPTPDSPLAPPDSGKSDNHTWIYVLAGVLGGLALTLGLGAVVFFVFFRKRKQRCDPVSTSVSFEAYEKAVDKKSGQEPQDFMESLSSVGQSIKIYKFDELQVATNDFSPSCWIKGSVYRGSFNGDFAAIKKMNGDVSKELSLLNKLNHSNLIRLSGVCFNEGNWYIVYEYAANGPLSDWIYHSSSIVEKFLNWSQRVQIALDVATGLNYLHNFSSPPHVHKDIKASNVLLDSDFRAKIGNLSQARSAEGKDGEFDLTRHIVGTKGYMAPEYLENGLVSTKLDVYAFGVLMLEILTGKEVAALYSEENVSLSDLLTSVLDEEDGWEKLRQFIDPSMEDNYPLELAVPAVRLIDTCLDKNPSARPNMDEIVQSLSRILSTSMNWDFSVNSSAYQSFSRNS